MHDPATRLIPAITATRVSVSFPCHCERSEAIFISGGLGDCFASLAMTVVDVSRFNDSGYWSLPTVFDRLYDWC